MKMRTFMVAVLATVMAVSGFADLSFEYIDWANGPVQFIMTKEEAAQWKTLKTDDEAKAWVALFWARRDPTPDTPRNEFREQFEARVRWADENLAAGEKVRGAMSDRGKALVLYGMPKRIERSANDKTPGYDLSGNLQRDERETAEWIQWIYESEDLKPIFLVPRVSIRFIDRMNTNEYKLERGSVDLKASQERAAKLAIVNPNIKAAPVFAAAAPQAAAAPAAAATAAVQTELATGTLGTAVTEFKSAAKNPYDKTIYATTGEFVTAEGQTFVPVMLYIPKETGFTAASSLTFFGVVEDASGKSVLAFEEPAKLAATQNDFYVDKTLHLGAGKHKGYFGLADNGKPVAMVSADMDLAGTLDKDATAISPLLLSNNIYPMTEAQAPEDPFAFGGVKVVPKADRTFRQADELWYFFELRNPGVAEIPTDPNTVPVTGAPVAEPKVQVKIDVEGVAAADGKKVKMTAPPSEVAAIPMKGVPNHYGVGSAIPLSGFKPGEYTFTVKVIDTVKKASYTLSDKFRIVP